MLELFCDMNVVVPICEYFSWRCFWSKKKKVREAKIITRTMKGMTIVGVFFFFFLELFHMSVFSFFKTLLKKLELKFKVISQCKLLNLTLVSSHFLNICYVSLRVYANLF